MRPIYILLFLLLLAPQMIFAGDWYFTAGEDKSRNALDSSGKPGQSPELPLAGIRALSEKLAAARAGDRFFLKRGQVFFGTIVCAVKGSESAPILLSAYGDGPAPVLSDLARIASWEKAGQNIWSARIEQPAGYADFEPSMLLRDGVQLALGRYPNAEDPWGGCLPISGHNGRKGITASSIGNSPNWEGAEVVLRTRRWILDRLRVRSHKGGYIDFQGESSYEPYEGFGFFLQNHPAALDREGEWCYDRKKREILLYSTADPKTSVYEYPTGRVLADFSRSAFLSMEGLELRGGNELTLGLHDASGIRIGSCAFRFAGRTAVYGWNTKGMSLTDSEISDAQSNALNIHLAKGARIIGNRIIRTALRAGMGFGGDGQYNAIDIEGEDILIEGNRLEGTGYVPIAFSGDDIMIRRNIVDGYAMVKDDAGGIYSWSEGKKPNRNRVVAQNLIRNGIGAPDGQGWEGFSVNGVYMDDRTDHVLIEGNLIHDVAGSGIIVHNAHELEIRGNTCFNNGTQMEFIHDSIASGHPIRNVAVSGNVLFSAKEGQRLISIINRDDAEHPGIGFSGNSYSSPFRKHGQFLIQIKEASSEQIDVPQWISAQGRDPGGIGLSRYIEPYVVKNIGQRNLVKNGDLNGGLSPWGWWATYGNGRAELRGTGIPDGGPLPAVRLSFSRPSWKPDALFSFLSAPYEVREGTCYRLRFKARTSQDKASLSFLTRRGADPWTQCSEEIIFTLDREIREYKAYYFSTRTESLARVEFILREAGLPKGNDVAKAYVEIGDIDVREAETESVDTASSILFYPNFTGNEATIDLGGEYIDAWQKPVSGKTKIGPHSAGIFLKAER